MLRLNCWIWCCVILSSTVGNPLHAVEKPVNFAREILPILSDKCFICHGPDGQAKDELRLDSFTEATRDLGGRRAIATDVPETSGILLRIHSTDEPMPPADAEKQLTERERDLLSRWIREGGKYALHWSFVPPEKVLPTEINVEKKSDVIDAFIETKLQDKGVTIAEEAERATLARRVSLVLTGLPPDPQELAAFLDDQHPDAYERFVDRLLDSPHYGEHQARYWLDAVRYGDTHGLHLDNRRGIYPYRDWVIQAFNRNLPLDEFITWQLAGDLLPNPTLEQRVATGYVRMNPTTSEGGAIPEEFQAKNNFDRVETLGTVFLGMSLTCARCHTHKYDPIPQTEYYRLMAFFNSTAEPAMDGNKYEFGPVVKAPPNVAAWHKWNQLESAISELLTNAEAQVDEVIRTDSPEFEKWESASQRERLAAVANPEGPFSKLDLYKQALELSKQIDEAEKTFTTTLVAEDLPTARTTHVLKRGEYNLPTGDVLEPGVLAVMGAFPEDAPRNRLGTGAMVDGSRASARRTGFDQSRLATNVRLRTGPHARGLRTARPTTDASRTARLARSRTPRLWLGPQTDAAANGHEPNVSTEFRSSNRSRRRRKPPVRTRSEFPTRRGSDPRYRVMGQRFA